MTKESFDPPSGPPPGYYRNYQSFSSNSNQEFQPPPGPPPGYTPVSEHDAPDDANQGFQPPPGPPPTAPPEYAPWLAVPDSSLLPPAPVMTHQVSPTSNATPLSAGQAKDWCRRNPLYAATYVQESLRDRGYSLCAYGSRFGKPSSDYFKGDLAQRQMNTWSVRTRKKCNDCVLVTDMPYYMALCDDTSRLHGEARTIYFEVRVIRMGSADAESEEADAGIALGFVAPPYPGFRLPGWERGSLGVHGDDGRRYIDDDGGGQDFTTYFKNGETVGIGMVFKPARYQNRKRDVEVFFTREGQRTGGWDLYEDRDSDDPGSLEGLEGDHDLLAAVGMFGQVDFEVRFRREEWLFRP